MTARITATATATTATWGEMSGDQITSKSNNKQKPAQVNQVGKEQQ